MQKMIDRFLRYQRDSGHSPKTLLHYQDSIGQFKRWLEANGHSTDVEEIDANLVREWQAELRELGRSPSTIATRVRALKAFFNWLTVEEWIPKNPLAKLKQPKESDKPKDTFTLEEVDKLLATCDRQTLLGARDYALIMLLFSTGLRLNEVVSLQLDDVNWEQGLLIVANGKGGKSRVVPLGEKVAKALNRYLKHKERRNGQKGALFLTDDGRPMTDMALKLMLKRRGNKAGVHANPHKFRHTAAIEYLRNGGRAEHLRSMLGHSSYEMTLHYARIAGVDLLAEHEKADPTNKLKSK